MNLLDLQQNAIEKTQQCIGVLEKSTGVVQKVNIEFPLRGVCSGRAIVIRKAKTVVSATVQYHNHFLGLYTDDYINVTVPHEVAHIYDMLVNGKNDHGDTWKEFMKQLGVHNFDATSQYDISSLPSCKWIKVRCDICGEEMTISQKYAGSIHRRFHIPCGRKSYGAMKIVPPEQSSTNEVNDKQVVQTDVSKKDICRNIFLTAGSYVTRQAILLEFIKQTQISKATASTYYQLFQIEKRNGTL